MAVTEQYQQQVGSRKVGERQVCDKEEETQNRKRGEITQTTRVCTTTDILEPLYEIRTRPGYLDTQKIPRDAFRKVCELDALRAGMYSDVK